MQWLWLLQLIFHPSGRQLSNSSEILPSITCPKCGHRQQEGEECLRCGLIFKKYVKPALAADLDAGRSFNCGDWDGKKKLLLFLALLLALVLYLEVRSGREITHPPGILINSEPHMAIVKTPRPWKVDGKEIYPLVRFWLQGRVLGSQRYSNDSLSDVCPIDIALGWGPMSDQSILDKLEIAQDNRMLGFDPADQDHPPPGYGTLWQYVKNVHTLPADDNIKKEVLSVRTGELIELAGYLVGIKENGQWTAISSLKKETGLDHTTCLIFWVTDFRRLP
jgi:hypothetical protein